MRWFKHLTDTRQDEKIARLLAQGGHTAYGLWWMLLETVARQVDKGSDKCSVTYPISKWSTELSLRGSHVKRSLLKLSVTGLVKVEWSGCDGTVTIPNLLKYRDEYQARIGSESRARIQKQSVEKEVERPRATSSKSDVAKGYREAQKSIAEGSEALKSPEQLAAIERTREIVKRLKETPRGKAALGALGV